MLKSGEKSDRIHLLKQLTRRADDFERRNPELIQGSRKRRITRGSGLQVQDLNRLLKQHKQMQKMMKKMKGGGMEKMMRGMGGMMPPGGPGGAGGPGGGFPFR